MTFIGTSNTKFWILTLPGIASLKSSSQVQQTCLQRHSILLFLISISCSSKRVLLLLMSNSCLQNQPCSKLVTHLMSQFLLKYFCIAGSHQRNTTWALCPCLQSSLIALYTLQDFLDSITDAHVEEQQGNSLKAMQGLAVSLQHPSPLQAQTSQDIGSCQ